MAAVMDIRKILFATDFSKSSGHALDYAILMAKKFSSQIHLLHVVQPVPPLVADLAFTSAGLHTGSFAFLRHSQEHLGAIAEKIGLAGIHVTVHCREGLPYDEIMAMAEEQMVDLIVLGTHGLTGLSHVLMGSVAEQIVRNANSPVLTVRHPDFGN